ncbi:hypothetical protein K3555_19020 [Leisingera sp. M527]|nr:hypothetical protein [Leisingera sp. M527]UWQ32587.1 hypothetical protein K3555_19020 [Leisingera sp. M527]
MLLLIFGLVPVMLSQLLRLSSVDRLGGSAAQNKRPKPAEPVDGSRV